MCHKDKQETKSFLQEIPQKIQDLMQTYLIYKGNRLHIAAQATKTYYRSTVVY